MKKSLNFPNIASVLYFAGCAGILAANIVLLYFTDHLSFNVDRASGLYNWCDYLQQGIHPYRSLTHMGHHLSVFPVWAVLHFPFYCLGDVGYSQLFFLVLLFITLLFCFKQGHLSYISLMAMSPAFWYHCAMRSDLLSNLLITLIFILLLFRYQSYWLKHKSMTALITGTLMCTRIFVVIPLFLFFFRHWLDFSWRNRISFLLLCMAGFTVPFVPFMVMDYEPLMASWRLQTTHGSGNVWAALACLVLTAQAALKLKSERQLFFWSGFILFAVTFLVSLETIMSTGFDLFLSEDLYDISYYSACFPFLSYFLSMDDREDSHEDV
jgi:hypothetical protein